MVKLLPYLVIPTICAAMAMAIGYFGAKSARPIASVGSLVTLVTLSAALEVMWHEASRLEGFHELRVIFATALALTLVALPSFLQAWFATRRGNVPSSVLLTSALVSVATLAVYPFLALFILCYVGHDCI